MICTSPATYLYNATEVGDFRKTFCFEISFILDILMFMDKMVWWATSLLPKYLSSALLNADCKLSLQHCWRCGGATAYRQTRSLPEVPGWNCPAALCCVVTVLYFKWTSSLYFNRHTNWFKHSQDSSPSPHKTYQYCPLVVTASSNPYLCQPLIGCPSQ